MYLFFLKKPLLAFKINLVIFNKKVRETKISVEKHFGNLKFKESIQKIIGNVAFEWKVGMVFISTRDTFRIGDDVEVMKNKLVESAEFSKQRAEIIHDYLGLFYFLFRYNR